MPRSENPIDPRHGPVAELATGLRAVRERAGSPTYRALATRAGYSPAVLSQAAAGRRMPTWPVLRAFLQACGIQDDELLRWKRRWHETVAAQEEYSLAPQSDQAGGDNSAPTSVFIVDDHEVARRGLRRLLDEQPDLTVVGEAESVFAALNRIPGLEPDVVILDVRLPDGTGIDLCRTLRSMLSPPRCLILTAYGNDELLADAIDAGAAAYLLKNVTGRDLTAAVRAVAAGGALLYGKPDETAAYSALLQRLTGRSTETTPYDTLSKTERRVLDLVAAGLTNREIAQRLYLAEKTVSKYVTSLIHKLGLPSRTAAAVFGSRRRIGQRRLEMAHAGRVLELLQNASEQPRPAANLDGTDEPEPTAPDPLTH